MKNRLLGVVATLAGIAALTTAQAATLSKVDARAAAAIKQNLETRFPNAKILSVTPSALVPGFYEVFTGDTVSLSNATGDLVLVGSIIDTKSKRNLSVERVDELGSVDFASLPFDRAIKTVKGNGSRKIAVFSDPECPFCQQLEKEMASINDVTIYTFLYPIASLHPAAPERAHALWCQADRSNAWTQWMVFQKVPEQKTCEGDPVDQLQKLGSSLNIVSTPTLFSASGKRFAGTLPAPSLDKFIDGKSSSELNAETAKNTQAAVHN